MKKRNCFSHVAVATAAAAMCAAIPMLSACAAQTLAGDADKNGVLGVSDIIALQKYLLGSYSFDKTAYDNANVYADDTVDVFDLGILKHMVLSEGTVTPPSGDTVVASIVFSENTVTLYDADDAVVNTADASNVTVSNGTYVTITKSGVYTISGVSSNGQIKVSTDNTSEPDALVEMSFEDLVLSNDTVAPVYVENVGDEAVISAKKGTTSIISDGTSHTDTYTNSEGTVKDINAAIFSRDDLKIKGKGTLTVNGNTEDGIVCTKDVKLWNSTLQVNAVDDGVRGDTVRVGDTKDATNYETLNVSITTQTGDGIKADSTETGKGYVTVSGGTLTIRSYADGIQAEQDFNMTGGTVDIYTYEGSAYSGSSGSNNGNWGGGPGGWGGNGGNSSSTEVSAKGIKAVGLYDEAGTTWQSAGNITISGGTLTIDSSDDALHCSGKMNLTGGTMRLATADDALHSDSTLVIGTEGGDFDTPYIDITKSYEGVEGVDITVNSGTVLVTASDDGYNAAGGADGSGSGGMGGPGGGWGQGSFGGGSQTLVFNGGYTYVNAGGDGLDSNGSLTVNGGYVFVSQTGGGNSPIDCDSTWSYNGGVVIAGGTSDMFSESIPNNYQFVSASGAGISAGDVVTFADANGTVLGTMTFTNAAAALVICAPESGSAYKGGTLSDVTYFDSSAKAGYNGTISGGTVMTSNSSSGGWGQGGMGGRQAAPAGRARGGAAPFDMSDGMPTPPIG